MPVTVFGFAIGGVAGLTTFTLLWWFALRAKFRHFEEIVPILRDMVHEFAPNTGNSLRDRINSIERIQGQHTATLAGHGRDLGRSLASVDNLHVRLDHVVEETIRRLDRRRIERGEP